MVQERTVTVAGSGSGPAAADGAQLTLAAEAVGGDPGAALAAAAAAAAAMIEAVVGEGVDRGTVRTTGVTVQPRWDHRSEEPELVGYTAGTTFDLPVEDLAAAGRVLSAAMAAGGTAARVRDLTLTRRDPAQAQRSARERAFASARATAEQYAELAGAVLGELLHLAEGTEPSGWTRPGRDYLPALASAAYLPVLPGAEDLTVRITATWELRHG